MARNMLVVLSDHFAEFVDELVETERYDSASDVIRAGLRLLEDREVRLASLRAALVDGEKSGPPSALDVEEFLAGKRIGRSG